MNSRINEFQLYFMIQGRDILDLTCVSSIIPRRGEMIIIGGVSYDVCQVRYDYHLRVVDIILSLCLGWRHTSNHATMNPSPEPTMGEPPVKRSSFYLKMWDDEETREKSQFLGNLEVMFDHSKNSIPEDFFAVDEGLSLGSRIRVTFEIMDDW